MKSLGSLTLVVALSIGATACTKDIRTHGYAPPPEEISGIQVGTDTRGSVRRKIGRPSVGGVFTNDGWYYVSTQVEYFTFYEPEVINRRLVAVRFDDKDTVTSINSYGLEDGRVIDLETRTTPTFGRELTIMQQLLGNIGAITPDSVLGN